MPTTIWRARLQKQILGSNLSRCFWNTGAADRQGYGYYPYPFDRRRW